jgi:trimethylamine:corrinoid methyltransferase-like protein
MFEQNNIGVRLQNPIAKAIERLTESGSDVATAEYILSIAEKIVTALEGMVPGKMTWHIVRTMMMSSFLIC